MTQNTITNPIWTNPADPLARYRYGNPSNLLWHNTTTTQQPEPVKPTAENSRNCCDESLLAIVVLVVAVGALALTLWRYADRPYE